MEQANPLQQIINAAAPLLVTLVSLVFAALANAIRAKVKSEQARGILLRLSEQASDVVLELEQTLVAGMREAAADGKLDRDDVDMLKAAALAKLKNHLGTKGKAEAVKVLGFADEAELETVLRAKIEAEVAKARALIGAKVKGLLETAPKPSGVG